jgi:hypothetical protein
MPNWPTFRFALYEKHEKYDLMYPHQGKAFSKFWEVQVSFSLGKRKLNDRNSLRDACERNETFTVVSIGPMMNIAKVGPRFPSVASTVRWLGSRKDNSVRLDTILAWIQSLPKLLLIPVFQLPLINTHGGARKRTKTPDNFLVTVG